MSKSKFQIAWEKRRWSDPGWEVSILPVAGDGGFALVMSKEDKYTGRVMYGRALTIFAREVEAKKCKDKLDAYYNEQMARAYP